MAPKSQLLSRRKNKITHSCNSFYRYTTWIASSRSNMQKILNEVAIFYKANDSQINSKKSVLVAINASEKDSDKAIFIGPNKEALKKTNENEFIRYLEV